MQHLHKDQRLTERVANILREEIQRAKSGDRLDSFRCLAKRFDVSKVTISEALLILSQEGLISKRHGSGTYVTDCTQRQHVAIVLGIHPMAPHFTFHPFRLLEQLHFFFNRQGLMVHTYWALYAAGENTTDPAYDELAQNLDHGRVSGIVLARGPLNARWENLLNHSGLSVVGQERDQSVEQNYHRMIRVGARFLIKSGRRNLAMLFGSDPSADPVWNKSWKEAVRRTFLDTLKTFDAQSRDAWIRGDFGAATAGAGYEQFKEIWTAGKEKPDGLLVCDDHLFTDATIAILEMGVRVPDQLMVATHANKDSGVLYPFPTARMEHDLDLTAQSIGNRLLQRIRNEPVSEAETRWSFRWVGAEDVLARASGEPAAAVRIPRREGIASSQ